MGLVVDLATPILEGLHEKGPLVTLRNAMSEAQDAPWLDGKTIYRDSWRCDLRTELDPYGWHMEIWVPAVLMARVSPESL